MNAGVLGKILSVFVARGVIKISNLIVFLIISRALGADGLGLFGAFSSAILIGAAAGNLGIRQALSIEIGAHRLGIRSGLTLARVFLPVLGCVTSVVVYYLVLQSIGPPTAWALPLVLGVWGAIFVTLNQGVFLGAGRIRDMNRYEVLPRLVLLVGVLVLLAIGQLTMLGVFYAFSTGFMVSGVMGSLVKLTDAEPSKDGATDTRSVSGTMVLGLVKQGWPFALTLALIMLNSRISVFMLPRLETAAAAGHYFASVRLNEIFLETATAIGLVLFSQSVQEADSKKAIRETADVTRWIFLMLATISFVAFILAPFLIVLLFGKEFQGAEPILKIICFGLPFAGLNRILYQVIAARGRPLVGAAIYGPVVVINVVVSYLTISDFGVVGGAWTLLGTQVFIFVSLVIYIGRTFDVSAKELLILTADDLSRVGHIADKVKRKLRQRA